MISSPRSDAALRTLREAGHQIGETFVATDGTRHIWIDNVPCAFEDVIGMAEEEEEQEERKGLEGATQQPIPPRNRLPSGPHQATLYFASHHGSSQQIVNGCGVKPALKSG